MKQRSIILLSAVILTVASSLQANPEACEEPLGWGCEAPDFRLPSVDVSNGTTGDSISLSDYDGKVILLNLFGYTCDVCQDHREDLEAINQMFAGEDFQLVNVDVWNGPAFFVWNWYGGCSPGPCLVTGPLLLRGGINDVHEEFCMFAPNDDRGFLVIDKCGIIREYRHYTDFDAAAQQSIMDTIATYLAPPPAPAQLTVTPADGGVQLSWKPSRPCNGGYDLFSSESPDFDVQLYLGRFEDAEAFIPSLADLEFFHVKTVFPNEIGSLSESEDGIPD